MDIGFRGVHRSNQLTDLCENKSWCIGQIAHAEAQSRKRLCVHMAEINCPLACFPRGACSTPSCITMWVRQPAVHVLGKVRRGLGYRLDPIGFEIAENLET